jgi:hypothetical protein
VSLTVMIIVLFAALLHASWNFLVKSTDDKHLSMSAVVVGHTPFAVVADGVGPSEAAVSTNKTFSDGRIFRA